MGSPDRSRNVFSVKDGLNDDLVNVLTSVGIPIVLLGRDGTIRRFTPAAGKLLRLSATDVGRPLSDIEPVPDLLTILADVVERGMPVERDVKDAGGRWHSLAVRPYRTLDDHIDGAVMVLVDIDAHKKGEEASAAARDAAERIVDTLSEGIFVLDRDLRVRSANRSFFKRFKLSTESVIGRRLGELAGGEWKDAALAGALESVRAGKPLDGFRFEREFPGIGRRLLLLNARRIEHGDGAPMVLLAIEDVTDAVRTVEAEENERRILAYQEKLRRMAFDAALAEDRERRRIAMGLHDGVGQTLALLQNRLASARSAATAPVRKTIDGCVQLIEEAICQTRTLTFDLSPPILYDLGLDPALRWLAEQVEKRYGVHVHLDGGENDMSLEPEVAAIVFRSVRELLTNVAKHAKVDVAQVTLSQEGKRAAVTVDDEGAGFDMSEWGGVRPGSGYGLFSIREQVERLGGSMSVRSAPDQGTHIALVVPLSRPPSESRQKGSGS